MGSPASGRRAQEDRTRAGKQVGRERRGGRSRAAARSPAQSAGRRRRIGAVHRDDVSVGLPVVLHPAAVRQDGAAGARWLLVGVGRGAAVLSGRAARRLRLCASADTLRVAGIDRLRASRRRPAGAERAARRTAGDVARAAARRSVHVAARALRRRGRPAVRRGRRQRAAAAGLVRALGPQARAGSVLSLRRLQSRQPHRAARLSVPVRAGAGADGDEPLLGDALSGADRRHRGVLRAGAPARRIAGGGNAISIGRGRSRADVDQAHRLVWTGAGAGGAAHGVHDAHRHRHRLGAAAVGHPSGDLPLHLRARLPVALAAADVAAAAGAACRRDLRAAGAGPDQARQMGADERGRRRRFLPCRPRRAPHAVSQPPAGPLSHRVLFVDVVRRRARRPVLGAHRPTHLLRGVRIPAAHRAVARLPAGRVRPAGIGKDRRGVDLRDLRSRAAADLAGTAARRPV